LPRFRSTVLSLLQISVSWRQSITTSVDLMKDHSPLQNDSLQLAVMSEKPRNITKWGKQSVVSNPTEALRFKWDFLPNYTTSMAHQATDPASWPSNPLPEHSNTSPMFGFGRSVKEVRHLKDQSPSKMSPWMDTANRMHASIFKLDFNW
jgi:hypothetical protein